MFDQLLQSSWACWACLRQSLYSQSVQMHNALITTYHMDSYVPWKRFSYCNLLSLLIVVVVVVVAFVVVVEFDARL